MSQSSLQLHSQCLFLYYHSLLVSPSLGCSTGTKRTKENGQLLLGYSLSPRSPAHLSETCTHISPRRRGFSLGKIATVKGFVVWQSYVKLSLKGLPHFLMSSLYVVDFDTVSYPRSSPLWWSEDTAKYSERRTCGEWVLLSTKHSMVLCELSLPSILYKLWKI